MGAYDIEGYHEAIVQRKAHESAEIVRTQGEGD